MDRSFYRFFARRAPADDYELVLTGRVDPFAIIPTSTAPRAGTTGAAARPGPLGHDGPIGSPHRRGPYMYTCSLSARH
jgi:hypothetical protein